MRVAFSFIVWCIYKSHTGGGHIRPTSRDLLVDPPLAEVWLSLAKGGQERQSKGSKAKHLTWRCSDVLSSEIRHSRPGKWGLCGLMQDREGWSQSSWHRLK